MTQTATVVDSGNRSTPSRRRLRAPSGSAAGLEMGGGESDDGALQVREVRDACSGEDRREDDLEHDHHDHRDGPLPEQGCEAEADDEPDDGFELDPQSGLDHERVRRRRGRTCE